MNSQPFTDYCRTHYRRIADLALEVGDIMLSHGAETNRVEDTICRILNTTGFSQAEAYVSLTGIILSLDDPSLANSLTLVRRISQRTNNLGRIAAANELSRRFVSGQYPIEEALQQTSQIRQKHIYSSAVSLLCFPLVAAAFTFMFKGSPRDAAAAALMSLFAGTLRLGLTRLKLMQSLQDFLCSAFLGLTAILFTIWIPLGQHLQPIIAGAIMLLVPGVTLTVSFRDLAHGDYISGIARFLEAVITALCIAAGISIVLRLYEFFVGPIPDLAPQIWITFGTEWIIPSYIWFEVLCSFLASVFFCILFETDRQYLLWCGLAGAIVWLVYRTVELYSPGLLLCNFIAALIASWMAYKLARHCKAPVTIFFTAGIFCLVPGYRIYLTMFYFLGQELEQGVIALLNTLGIAVLIAAAMAVHSSLWNLKKQLRRP